MDLRFVSSIWLYTLWNREMKKKKRIQEINMSFLSASSSFSDDLSIILLNFFSFFCREIWHKKQLIHFGFWSICQLKKGSNTQNFGASSIQLNYPMMKWCRKFEYFFRCSAQKVIQHTIHFLSAIRIWLKDFSEHFFLVSKIMKSMQSIHSFEWNPLVSRCLKTISFFFLGPLRVSSLHYNNMNE